MYVKQHFPFRNSLVWIWEIFAFQLMWSGAVTAAYVLLGWTWLAIPVLPVSVLGTAVSFYLGFKGNAAYGRLWEARKIWGGIVNTSRTWGIHVRSFIDADLPVHQELLYRHVAWLGALRIQLLRAKGWEHREAWNDEARRGHGTLDTSDEALSRALDGLVDHEERAWLLARKNRATQLLGIQARRLKELRADEAMDAFQHVELAELLETMFTLQGQCERIKNFPLPRQYATTNHWFVKLFIGIVPLGLLGAFNTLGEHHVWLVIPTSMVLGWVFYLWDRVLDYSENPFEGLTNDIPMRALSRTIEIDLREMLGETDLPPAVQPVNDVLL